MKRKGRSIKVLLVDDNEAYRSGLSEFLEHQKGIEVVGEAGGGQQAIYLARTLAPDLVLMDISMPGTNGLVAAREIKAFSPHTKIVFVTVHKEETYQALGELLGADGYVSKNLVKEGLTKVLKNIEKSEAEKSATMAW